MKGIVSNHSEVQNVHSQRLRWVLLHGLAGAAAGYVLLHPLSMLIHYSCYHPEYGGMSFLVHSFRFEHLHMAIYFAALGMLAGMVQGMYTQRLRVLFEEARALSLTDELTSLPNRRHFLSELGREIERSRRFGKPLCMLIIDTDNFKRYNDTYGHLAGDRLLKEFGKFIRTSVRTMDIVGRYGGDEFVVVMPETVKATAYHIAERLRCELAQHPLPDEVTQPRSRVTVSIGIAEFPSDSGDLQQLIKEADIALYKAKELGRNRVCQANGCGLALCSSGCGAERGHGA